MRPTHRHDPRLAQRRVGLARLGESAREFMPRCDSELAVRVAEMHLDRLRRDVESLCNVAVCLALCGETRDPSLARSQGAHSAESSRARARACGVDLRLDLIHKGLRTA